MAGSESLPTQRNCVHAFNIHSYLSGVSILQKKISFGFPKGANRDAFLLYVFSISNKTSVSHTETGLFMPVELARETLVKLTTHTSICVQPATSLIMTSATVILTSSPGGLSAANQTPVASGRHHSVLKRARVRPHLYDLWKLWNFMRTVYVGQNIIFSLQETSGLLKY